MSIRALNIVGLGLMGGSLAGACRKAFPHLRITGISRDAKALKLALKRGWIHAAASTIEEADSSADLWVLCTPVDTLKKMITRIDAAAKQGALVTDVGSVKGDVQRWADARKFKSIRFVGAHPLAGSHERGMEAARADLYRKGLTFVIRGNQSKRDSAAFSAVKQFWNKVTPKVFEVSAAEHDAITAEISHLPHLAAFCLSLTPGQKSLTFAGTGFLDTTRVAQGHPSVWGPIFLANRRAVTAALTGFEARLRDFKKALKKSPSALEKFIAQASRRRRQISL